MLYEEMSHIDKKIKEAADNHFPVYDDAAWEKMEQLLDRHLPQKRDKRRRFIFFLFLFLMLAGPAYLFFKQQGKIRNSIAQVEKNDLQHPRVMKEFSDKSEKENGSLRTPLIVADQNGIKRPASGFENKSQNIYLKPEQHKVKAQVMIYEETGRGSNSLKEGPASLKNRFTESGIIVKEGGNETSLAAEIEESDRYEPGKIVQGPEKDSNSPMGYSKTDSLLAEDENSDETVINQTEAGKKSLTKKPGVKKRVQNLALAWSTGPDISKVSSGSTGKITHSYGAGILYTRNRFSLRSGFYVAKKIYSAGPDNYKLPYTLPPNLKLINVDANCLVYEIPLVFLYNFKPGNKGNIYTGMGLSSYIMKKEDYSYYYKNTYGQYSKRDYKYKNKNDHLFSVLNLLGGYNFRLNKNISISTEAYLKIPFEGIGAGKVRLNSAGLLFSVGFHPFGSSNTTRKPAER